MQSHKCAMCLAKYTECHLSMSKVVSTCADEVTINTGERASTITKHLDRLKEKYPVALVGFAKGGDLVAHINPSEDHYASLAPTDPASLHWLQTILDTLPSCRLDETTGR